MTPSDVDVPQIQAPPGRFWVIKRLTPFLRPAILGLLPCPDLISRIRTRHVARGLVALKAWAGMDATSAETAQLAMMRLLSLQRQTRRAVRGRHREAAAMLARACVETLFLGLYCLREPKAVAELHAGNLKALGDGFAYVEETGVFRAEVLLECVARLGQPSRRHMKVWDMVTAIDAANDSQVASSLYRRLYIPLSNFTVHANGGTLLRHVRADGQLRWRPGRAWARRSPARVADAAVGVLAADLARDAGQPDDKLRLYAERHIDRTLMPMAIMAFAGMGSSAKPRQLREMIKTGRDIYTYLWSGPASADSIETRAAYLRERFASVLKVEDSDLPEGVFDPLIDHLAENMSRAVPAAAPVDPPDS